MIPLLLATHQWHSILENGKRVACVFFDLSKAFDKVPLLNRLFSLQIPIPLIRWISNYLSNHYQQVILNGVSSPLLPVTSGVPQCSILGPLLFLIYINDLCNTHFSPGTKILLYADDILLYKPISSSQDFTSFQNINLISNWVADNHLAVNLLQTKFMLISRSCSRPCIFPSLFLNGSKLERVSHFKYLGVWISDDLSWSKHIESICSKSRRSLGYIFRTFSPHCDPAAVLSLYKFQVLPVLE